MNCLCNLLDICQTSLLRDQFFWFLTELPHILITQLKKKLINIRLLCLPSNTTRELQLLDKSVYRSFEAHWDQEVLKLKVLKVWSKCMINENIIHKFRAIELYPYDESIPLSAFAPSELIEQIQTQLEPNRI